VCAPAGYGKTTSLALHAQRLRTEHRLVGWMSCDRYDADAHHLWPAVFAALSAAVRPAVDAGGGRDPFGSLTPPTTMERAFLGELVEAVDDVDATITLVLDDFQEINDAQTLAGVADFLSACPDRLRLIIGCRRNPAIPLHRLRLDGRLQELRAKDLAFERDEVEEVLRIQGVHLDPADLTTLWRRTEGWPAAVRLASLSLAQESDPAAFVAQFAGDDSAVAAYLVAEILGRLSEGRRQFLLHTCVAAELTAELAAALSGRSDAGALLDQMAQANALVQRLGRSGEWFRYHTLLRSHLLAELHRRDVTATRALHRNAALWFDEADMAALAVEHAVAARDDAVIESMLARHGIRLMLTGSGPLVARAIEESPQAVRDAPDVLLLPSIVAFDADDRAAGDQAFKRFQAQSEPVGAAGGQRLLEVARLYHARLHGDTGVLLDVGTQPGREPWDEDAELLMLTNRGWLRHVAGDYRGAKTDLCAALELSRHRGLDHLTLDCMNLLAGVAVALSDIRESSEWTRRTADLAAEHGWASSPRLAYAHMLASWCAHLMLDMDEASRHSAKSLAVLGGGATGPDVAYAARSAAAIIAFDRYPRRRAALRDLGVIWHHELASRGVPGPAAFGAAKRRGLAESHRHRPGRVVPPARSKRARGAHGPADRAGDRRAAGPAVVADRRGDRRTAPGQREHRQDPHALAVPQARGREPA